MDVLFRSCFESQRTKSQRTVTASLQTGAGLLAICISEAPPRFNSSTEKAAPLPLVIRRLVRRNKEDAASRGKRSELHLQRELNLSWKVLLRRANRPIAGPGSRLVVSCNTGIAVQFLIRRTCVRPSEDCRIGEIEGLRLELQGGAFVQDKLLFKAERCLLRPRIANHRGHRGLRRYSASPSRRADATR